MEEDYTMLYRPVAAAENSKFCQKIDLDPLKKPKLPHTVEELTVEDPSVQNEELIVEDPKNPDSQQVKRRRRDPRPGVFIEQSKDQPVIADEDEDGLYEFDFETAKETTETPFDFETTATTTATETGFDFEANETRMDVDTNPIEIPVTATVSAPSVTPVTESTPLVSSTIGSSSGATHDEPCSSKGKQPEEALRMPIVDDSSVDDEFINVRELKRRIVILEQDSIHKDAKIIQLEDTIVQKNQQIDQLQGDVGLLFNMVYDLRGKLEKKFGDEFIDPTDTERRGKAKEDRARALRRMTLIELQLWIITLQ
ncbi:uncharacterized protein LOC110875907 [Helianthus annuus]|uniref:uncharacterized protein LOC110875907 n=1 Tax=Helianthus annuus TaxID=4232 RepID=UPI000B8EF458|nr:uncharacterized protein LOC110875907 [Helianthus annuus]